MKKVLSFILVLSMVLSSFGMAFAAPAKNEIAGHLNEDATIRLADLGIVQGDDRGFALDANITRAEFAVLLVRALGLEGSANVAKGETQFTDVTVAAGYEWASGAINVATRLGYIQGYGNGKFGPADNIRYEDAVTLMVRALGYEPAAQAKGGYPVGYLVVAEQDIKNTKHVEGATGIAITRGSVFQLLDNSLTKPKMVQVGFGNDTKYVVSGTGKGSDYVSKQTILTTNLGFDEVEGRVIANYRVDKLKADEIKIAVEKVNGEEAVKTTKYSISDKFDFDVDAILGLKVAAWYNDDKDELFRYEVETQENDIVYGTVKENKEDKNTLKVEITNKENKDTKYEWAERDTKNNIEAAVAYVGNETEDVEDIKAGLYGKFVLDEHGDVTFAYLFDFDADKVGMALEVKNEEIKFASVDAIDEDVIELDDYKAEDVFVFNTDFSKASLEDIKAGTAVFGWENDDDELFIVIKNEVAEGTLEAARISNTVSVNRVTVEGKNISVNESAIFTDNKGDTYSKWGVAVEDLVDEEITVVLDLTGKALVLTTDANVTSNTIYGIVTDLTEGRNPVVTVYTNEGKEVEYKFEDRVDAKDLEGRTSLTSTDALADEYQAVGFKLNKDGEIVKGSLTKTDKIVVDELTANKASKDKFIEVDGNKYYLREKTVVLKALSSKGALKPSVIKYQDIIERTINAGEEVIVIGEAGKDANLIVFTNKAFEAKDDTLYGLVTSAVSRKGSDYKVEIHVAGEGKAEYTVATKDAVKNGEYISFTLNNKGVVTDIQNQTSVKDKDAAVKVEAKDNDYLKLETTWRPVTKDTVIYKTDKDGALDGTTTLARISDTDSVVYLLNENNEIAVIVVVTKYHEVEEGNKVVGNGIVTFLDTANNEVEIEDNKGNVTVYEVTGSARQLFAKVGSVDTFDGAKVGDEVKVKLTNGRLTGLEVTTTAEDLAEAAEKKVVNTELAKVNASYTAAYSATVNETLVEGLVKVDATKVTVTVTEVTAGSKYKVELTSKADTTIKASKEVTITKGAANNDVSVKSVKVMGLTATKDSKLVYSVTLPTGATYDETKIVVVPTDANATAAVAVEGATVDQTTEWTVEVEAEDGTTTETYTIKVTIAQ